jgi:peptidoglycan hydrolase-like protein with peptidoglycan-binding domain
MLLAASGQPLKVDGIFSASTRSAVRAFQAARGLPVTGGIGDKTWTALRRFTPRPIAWDKLQPASKPGLTPARASSAQVPRGGPASSTLPARAYEIPPSGRLSAR